MVRILKHHQSQSGKEQHQGRSSAGHQCMKPHQDIWQPQAVQCSAELLLLLLLQVDLAMVLGLSLWLYTHLVSLAHIFLQKFTLAS